LSEIEAYLDVAAMYALLLGFLLVALLLLLPRLHP
jgi:hypothetical protein